MEVSRVVVLVSRPVAGRYSKCVDCKSDFITEEKGTPGWPGPFYKCSHLDPEAAYGLSSARTVGRLQLQIH
jgi:hypothetical protein